MKYTKEMKLLSDFILEEDHFPEGFTTVDTEYFLTGEEYMIVETPSGKYYRWGRTHYGAFFKDKKRRLDLVEVFKHTKVTIEETWHTSKPDTES